MEGPAAMYDGKCDPNFFKAMLGLNESLERYSSEKLDTNEKFKKLYVNYSFTATVRPVKEFILINPINQDDQSINIMDYLNYCGSPGYAQCALFDMALAYGICIINTDEIVMKHVWVQHCTFYINNSFDMCFAWELINGR